MNNEFNRDWVLWELKQCLRALATPGPIALSTEPDGAVKADELALDYDNFVTAALGNIPQEFTEQQREALSQVNDALAVMSGMVNAHLWTEDAVINHPAWEKVRILSRNALEIIGWEGEPLSWQSRNVGWRKTLGNA